MLVKDLIGGEIDGCGPDQTISDVAQAMMEHGVGSLAVVDKGDLVGILTERDILRLVSEGRDPAETKVRAVMTPDPDSLGPEVSVSDAANWMMAAGYRHMPVLEEGDLIGMVSIKDVLWALLEDQ